MNANEDSTMFVNRIMTAPFLTGRLLMLTPGVPLASELTINLEKAVHFTGSNSDDLVVGP